MEYEGCGRYFDDYAGGSGQVAGNGARCAGRDETGEAHVYGAWSGGCPGDRGMAESAVGREARRDRALCGRAEGQ